MCGIIAGISQRDIANVLLEGLKRLEYRGYDSAGLATIHHYQLLQARTKGKVSELAAHLKKQTLPGTIGIAHTRWATHGEPSQTNAHPHFSQNEIAVVHNGVIENAETLRASLEKKSYHFVSQTDTEVIPHAIHYALYQQDNFLNAVKQTVAQLEGAFALGILHKHHPDYFIAVRKGSPLVIGLGINENFVGSDRLALQPLAEQFIYLEDGDIAIIHRNNVEIYNEQGDLIDRPIKTYAYQQQLVDRGVYRHFMLKEIFEQPQAVTQALSGRLTETQLITNLFGYQSNALFSNIESIHIAACGTSYLAGLVGHYWIESLAKIACHVEIASEYRYRNPVVKNKTLFLTLSQSGETADTLAALHAASSSNYLSTLGICNVSESTLVREAAMSFITHAGPEVGVASTKAFTTQLVALLIFTLTLARHSNPTLDETAIVKQLHALPHHLNQVLTLNKTIERLAERFVHKQHALFLGRGVHYPIAVEGALKLKELSYIHAEAYPAGELKHGPLALVDESMPVVAIAPNDALLEKLKSNLQEVRARGGELIVFAPPDSQIEKKESYHIALPEVPSIIAPIVYTVPLQLLAYHVAVLKGTDVDQPRNLAKSVTVE